jgi:hypothetical protein
MKKVISFFVVIMIAQLSFSQGLVKGTVVDKATNETLVGVSVVNSSTGTGVTTALDGSFSIKLPAGKQEITINYIGYTSKKVQVTTTSPDLGTIAIESEAIGLNDVTVTSSVAIRRKTPVALSVIEPLIIENKLGTQEFPEILKSTPGIYATKQGGGYGDSRVNLRGFEAPNIAVMINGVPMNDMEWGGIYWSNWGALSDVTRSMQVQRGLGASKIAAPSLGGSINVLTRSTDAVKGGSISYGIGNDGYAKIGFAVSTGLTANNWAITLLGSKTTSNGYIQGTEYEAYSYFLNISKKLTDNQQLSFTAFSAPQWHNQRNNSDKLLESEWAKQPLKGRYNASYGFDMNGQRKQSSYNYYNKPQISLNHFWTIDEKSSLSTVAYLSLGNGGGWGGQGYSGTDRTNWYGSTNGLINGYDDKGNVIANGFRNVDGTFNYGHVYDLNQPKDGVPYNGSTMVMSTAVNKHVWVGALSTYTTKLTPDIDFYGGIDLRYYKGTHTNVLTDLYGGKFFIDATSQRPLLTDQSWKTKKLVVGDVVYRDYDGFAASEGVFGQAEYNKNGLSAFVSLSGSNTSNWRYDRFYYDANQALSKTVNFLGYSAKGGANYNINANHNVFANIGVISRAPFFSGGAFLNAQVSNEVNKAAVNEKAFSAEIGYGFKSKYFTANLNIYRTNWLDKTMTTYYTGAVDIINVNLTGVNALHQGVELDFVSKPAKDLEITGMISLGDWTWQNNAKGYLFNSNGQPIHIVGSAGVVASTPDTMRVNIKGVHVGNSAQSTAALGFSYQILKGFRIGLDGNYFGRNYSSFTITTTTDPNSKIGEPWVIPDAVTVDFSANYRFKIGTFDATLVGNIYNLLDTQYITDAKDDGTYHTEDKASVFYGFGRTWSMNLKIRF